MVDRAASEGRPDLVAGRYRIIRSGTGGPGTASLQGFDERLSRPVTLEVLRPQWRAYPAVQAAFASAALKAARVQHHHVLRVFDVASDDGSVYIVTDLAAGGTLADRLLGTAAREAAVRRLAVSVLTALDAAHGAGLLHLDVAPGNVVFDEHGTIQLARFGVLDALYQAVRGAPASDAGAALWAGTDRLVLPAPMARRAPECRAGSDPSIATDLWCVGALLYRVLTGFSPRVGGAGGAVLPDPASLAALRPGTDPRLAMAVARALDPVPDRRFESAEEMAAALTSTGPEGADWTSTVAAAAYASRADDDDARTGPMEALARTNLHPATGSAGPVTQLVPSAAPDRSSKVHRTARASVGAGAAAVVAIVVSLAVVSHQAHGEAGTGSASPAASTSPARTAQQSPSRSGATPTGTAPPTQASSPPTSTPPGGFRTIPPAQPTLTAQPTSQVTAPSPTTTTPPTSTSTTPPTTTSPSTTTVAPTATTAPATTTPPTTTEPSTTTTTPASTTTTTTPPTSTTTTPPTTTAGPSTAGTATSSST